MKCFVLAASLLGLPALLVSAVPYAPPNDPPWFITYEGDRCNGKVLRQKFEPPYGACVNTAARPHSIHFSFPNPQGRCYVRFHAQADCRDVGDQWEVEIPAGENTCKFYDLLGKSLAAR